MERAARGAGQGQVLTALEKARVRNCTEVPLNGIETVLVRNGHCSIAIQNIHGSTVVAIIHRTAIIMANISTPAGQPHNANQMMEELNRRMGALDRTLEAENTWAVVVYHRTVGSDFVYGRKTDLPSAAQPEVLTEILGYLDQNTPLKDQVTFGSYDIYPPPTGEQLMWHPSLDDSGKGVMSIHGPKRISASKGTLVIEREDGRTKVYLEDGLIQDHPD